MKLTNGKIYSAAGVLQKLSTTKLPIKVAYTLKRNIDRLNKPFKLINEQRVELVKKYGEPMKDKPEEFIVSPEKREEFFKEFNELMDFEEEVDIRKLTIDELGDVEITPEELSIIEFMLDVED